MPTELHVSTTGQSFSLREENADLDERTAIWQGFRYGDGPDAVLITYGIQGKGYFRGIVKHFDEITKNVCCVMGYVFERHVRIYKRALRSKANVDVLFRGYPYGLTGPRMAWILVQKKHG